MNILISAYACNPYKGSEDGLGWNYVLSASKKHKIFVITRKTNESDINTYINDFHIDKENIHFHYIQRPFDNIPFIIGRLKYILWQKKALLKAQDIIKENKIDYVHHVTWASCVLPTKMYKLDIPLIYGPVGGGERIPGCIGYKMSLLDNLTEMLRIGLQKISKLFIDNRKTFYKAKIILVTTEETRALIPSKYHSKAMVMQAIGIRKEEIANIVKTSKTGKTFKIIMVGRLLFWKGFDIGIDAVKSLIDAGEDVELTIIGEGRKKNSLLRKIIGYESKIHLIGKVPYSEISKVYDQADTFLNCSLHDSGCSVILEAMSRGIPVICLDTGGPKVITTSQTAIKIQPNSYKNMVKDIAEAILKLKKNEDLRNELVRNALERVATEFDYNNKYDQIFSLFSEPDDQICKVI